MGEVINLRLARKAKARAEADRKAEETRAKFGQTKAARKLSTAEKKRADKAHDAGRIDKEE